MNEKEQQIEALQLSKDYVAKIITAVKNIIDEYRNGKKPDTDEYQDHILRGLNWIFQVYNGTKELLAADGSAIDKDIVNQSVIKLNEANNEGNDLKKADAYEGILAFLEEFYKEASKY